MLWAGSQVGVRPQGRQMWMSSWLLGASGVVLAQVEEVQPMTLQQFLPLAEKLQAEQELESSKRI